MLSIHYRGTQYIARVQTMNTRAHIQLPVHLPLGSLAADQSSHTHQHFASTHSVVCLNHNHTVTEMLERRFTKGTLKTNSIFLCQIILYRISPKNSAPLIIRHL